MRVERQLLFVLFIILCAFLFSCSSESKTISFNPVKLDFDTVNIGDTSTKDIVIKNKFGKDIQIVKLELSVSSTFTIVSSTSVPINMAKNAELTVSIFYSPIADGEDNTILKIGIQESTKEFQANITGIGKAVPRIDVNPKTHDFGQVYYNTSKTNQFTITNTGTAELVISAFNFTGTGAAAYSISAGGNTPYSIAVGSSENFTVEFLPTAGISYPAELVISHDAVNEDEQYKMTLAGIGTLTAAEFTLNQTSPWDYSDCAISFVSSRVLELTSNGLFDLNISNITLQTGVEFTISEILDDNGSPVSLPQIVPVGKKLSITIDFAPTAKQPYSDVLTIMHDATNHSQPLNFNIEGNGIDVRTKTFTYTGSSQSWVVPSGVTQARVLVVGGGGGGSGSHYGGGGSGYSIVKLVNVSGTITIVIGEGGVGGVTGTNSSPGGHGKDSEFGTLITATGGKGGGGGGAGYYTGGDGGSGGGGAGNSGYGGDGGSAGSNGLPGASYAGGIGGHFDSLTPFVANALTAGKGGAAGTSTNCGGGGAGGVLINGAGPKAGDGGDPSWSGKGGDGYGSGGGAGGYNSGSRPGGGKGADGVIYIEY